MIPSKLQNWICLSAVIREDNLITTLARPILSHRPQKIWTSNHGYSHSWSIWLIPGITISDGFSINSKRKADARVKNYMLKSGECWQANGVKWCVKKILILILVKWCVKKILILILPCFFKIKAANLPIWWITLHWDNFDSEAATESPTYNAINKGFSSIWVRGRTDKDRNIHGRIIFQLRKIRKYESRLTVERLFSFARLSWYTTCFMKWWSYGVVMNHIITIDRGRYFLIWIVWYPSEDWCINL